MRNIYAELLRGLESDTPLALATLIDTQGSTPQITGISALFDLDGVREGTLGGGILEANAEVRIRKALETGRSMTYKFDLNSDISEPVGAICGGEASILVDVEPRQHLEVFRAMRESLDKGQPGALLTCIGNKDDGNVVLARRWTTGSAANNDITDSFRLHSEQILQAIERRLPVILDMPENVFDEAVQKTQLFVDPVYPLMRLIICGAGHIGRALTHLAHRLEFEVTVIDDRSEFANKENIPEADHFIVAEIENGFNNVQISSDTYIVIVNRAHRGDAESLRATLHSDAAYIGMIGSSRKIRLMREKAIQEGWATKEQLDAVHAPVGLSIEAQSVEEIAISIAAELVAVRSKHLRAKGS